MSKIFCALIFVLTTHSATKAETTVPDFTAPSQAIEPEKKSLFWIPHLNIFLPGLGQAIDQQYLKSFTYFGFAGSGLMIANDADQKLKKYDETSIGGRNNYVLDLWRQKDFGQEMTFHAGLLSAFDSFQSRAQVYKKEGRFLFLPENQSMDSLLKAPFHFSYLKRNTTWPIFLMAMAAGYLGYNEYQPSRFTLRSYDVASSSYQSYAAGTGEEAYFRGVMYPMLYDSMGNSLAANAIQSLIFGYWHGIKWPIVQVAGGFYNGWLTERNQFDLGEAIFIHAWWDFWIIGAEYVRSRGLQKDYEFNIPAFQMSF